MHVRDDSALCSSAGRFLIPQSWVLAGLTAQSFWGSLGSESEAVARLPGHS